MNEYCIMIYTKTLCGFSWIPSPSTVFAPTKEDAIKQFNVRNIYDEQNLRATQVPPYNSKQ